MRSESYKARNSNEGAKSHSVSWFSIRSFVLLVFGALPWVVMAAGELSLNLLRYHPMEMAKLGVMTLLLILIASWRGSAYGALLSFSKASLSGLLFEALRAAYLFVIPNADCESVCLGIFNRVFGVACGAASEGCANESFICGFLFACITMLVLRFFSNHQEASLG